MVSVPSLTTVSASTQQPIHPGSYVYVANGLAATNNLTALTLECWVRPFVGRQTNDDFKYTGLITQFDVQNGAGYGLFVRFNIDDYNSHGGSVAFYLGNGDAFDPENPLNPLKVDFDFTFLETETGPGRITAWSELQWHHIVATWDGANRALWIDGRRQGEPQPFAGPVHPGSAPLRLAAWDGGLQLKAVSQKV